VLVIARWENQFDTRQAEAYELELRTQKAS
jgi:proton glutamate symport protein